jgi:hypothetical protein
MIGLMISAITISFVCIVVEFVKKVRDWIRKRGKGTEMGHEKEVDYT